MFYKESVQDEYLVEIWISNTITFTMDPVVESPHFTLIFFYDNNTQLVDPDENNMTIANLTFHTCMKSLSKYILSVHIHTTTYAWSQAKRTKSSFIKYEFLS